MIEQMIANYFIYGLVGYVLAAAYMFCRFMYIWMTYPLLQHSLIKTSDRNVECVRKQNGFLTMALLLAWPYNIPRAVLSSERQLAEVLKGH